MANQNDSFIDEVTDDLRRDRLFRAFRRFGWIAILAILLLVGFAVWREYSRDRDEKAAQAWGDAVLAAQRPLTKWLRSRASMRRLRPGVLC